MPELIGSIDITALSGRSKRQLRVVNGQISDRGPDDNGNGRARKDRLDEDPLIIRVAGASLS